MKRTFIFVLIGVLGSAPAALAGESLLASGVRHVQKMAAQSPAATRASAASTPKATVAPKPAASLQEQVGTLSRSGMSRRMKALIFIGIGVGFAAGAYAIDHSVVDVTPSTKGTRQD